MTSTSPGILDVLEDRGLERSGRFKLVRHREPSKGYDMEQFRAQGWLDWYAAYQSKPIFHGLEHIVCFVGVGRTQARFYGVYRVLSALPSEKGPQPPAALEARTGEDWRTPGGHYYRLEHVPGFEDIEDRVVIEWGAGTRSWHQHPRNKRIISSLP